MRPNPFHGSERASFRRANVLSRIEGKISRYRGKELRGRAFRIALLTLTSAVRSFSYVDTYNASGA